jgi:hypothetical protein
MFAGSQIVRWEKTAKTSRKALAGGVFTAMSGENSRGRRLLLHIRPAGGVESNQQTRQASDRKVMLTLAGISFSVLRDLLV